MREDPYQGIARWYDRLFEPLNAKLRAIGLGIAELNAGQSVLDVGCGTGSLLAICRTRGCVVHGIDKSAAMLNVARRKLGDAARLHAGDATRMPFDDAAFDRVTAMLTLHEMRQPDRLSVLREMRRVLKPDGRIILIDFLPGPLRPIPGWWVKGVIQIAELAAGREHFRNYRDFMKRGGLLPLGQSSALAVDRRKVVGGGALEVVSFGKNEAP